MYGKLRMSFISLCCFYAARNASGSFILQGLISLVLLRVILMRSLV